MKMLTGDMNRAQAMLKIFSDKATAVKLGNKGYEFVRSNFSWESITNRLIELYNAI